MDIEQKTEAFRQAANDVRNKLDFGRTHVLQNLFDYLVARSLKNETASEADIATVVLNKTGSEALLNASARVSVFRLRKKLEMYYEGAGRHLPHQLMLPRGEYRLSLITKDAVSSVPEQPSLKAVRRRVPNFWQRHAWKIGAAGASLAVGLALGFVIAPQQSFTTEQAEVRSTAPWNDILKSPRPITIVAGDYYIMGEKNVPDGDPARLVREYSINSRADLDEALMVDPSLQDRYTDLNLYYLPSSTAGAIRAVSAVLGSYKLDPDASDVVTSSALTPPQLKDNNLVYVGLLSGMGLLHQTVFADSRFEFVGSFDSIRDRKAGEHYMSEPPTGGVVPLRNFAYVASVPGPRGNRIIVIAGTRDAALLEAALLATKADVMEQLSSSDPHGYFEALYEVDGLGTQNLNSRLIAVEPRGRGRQQPNPVANVTE